MTIQQDRYPGAPPPDNRHWHKDASVPRLTDMMALKHQHHDMVVVVATTDEDDDAHKLLYLEKFSCFRVVSSFRVRVFYWRACRVDVVR
jgi:hypothetical protein